MSGESPIRHVLGSSVRTDTLLGVSRGPVTTDRVLESVTASESAVYNALSSLRRQGLIEQVDDSWRVTGHGQVVADLVRQQRRACDLLSESYWQTHDTGILPRKFRLRLPALAAADVVEGTDPDPHRAVREVATRVEAAEAPDIVSPIYHSEYEDHMPDAEDARLVLDREVVTQFLEDIDDPGQARDNGYDETEIRITDVDVALGVAGDSLLLSLPTLDGSYDSRTEVVAEDAEALTWGRQLFEHYWERAIPAEEFLLEYFS